MILNCISIKNSLLAIGFGLMYNRAKRSGGVFLMKTEFEVRLLECDVHEMLNRLKECGAEFVGDWLQFRNCYDFKPARDNSWIRLRTNGVETTLTIKEIKSSAVDGTKEAEIVVSDFETTNEILNKLGYSVRSSQENRRIRYMLDGVEIDIDFWPMIPAYVEFESGSEEKIKRVCEKLNISYNDVTTLDVQSIYEQYGINVNEIPFLRLEEDRKAKFETTEESSLN